MIVLRSALFNIFFFGVTFVLTLPATALRFTAPQHVLPMVRFWSRLTVGAARVICGIQVKVTGLEHVPPGGALIASAHQSAFDTFVWFTLLPDCCYVLKKELLRIPLFGPLILTARQIPVDRDAGASALRGLVRAGVAALERGQQVIIFPEGTRSEPGSLGPLQPGIAALAARAGVPVVPVATDSGRCWSRKAFFKRPGTITIAIGEPLPASLPREAMMRLLRERLGALTSAPEGEVEAVIRHEDESVDKSV